MYSISPTQIELFALRLLLNHVSGPTSYESLKTVEGVCCDTFQDAAIKRNLCKDDYIWIQTMNEANDSQTNIQELRRLFITILVHCQVSNHKQFYLQCKKSLKADIVHKYSNAFKEHNILHNYINENDTKECEVDDTEVDFYDSDNEWDLQIFASNSALFQLELLLQEQNKSLSDFSLPMPNVHQEQFLQNIFMQSYVTEEDDLSPEQAKIFFDANIGKLNLDQKNVFDTIKKHIEDYENDKM